MRPLFRSVPAATAAGLLLVVACNNGSPTEVIAHEHGPDLINASPDVREAIIELRQWSAPFHNQARAAEAGYTTSIGCIDETVAGVPRETARGMGYHVGGGADGLGYVDDVIELGRPEFLVYGPTQDGGSLETARLVGFDYFKPDPTQTAKPAPILGTEFVYNPVFQGWMAHIYLWSDNPDGMFANWNGKVPLCSAG